MTETEKILIDVEQYKNLKQMLSSSEEENVILALQCIKKLDPLNNIIAILALKGRQPSQYKNLWYKYCDKHIDYYRTLGISDSTYYTLSEIYEVYNKVELNGSVKKVNQLVFTELLNELIDSVFKMSVFDFLEDVKVTYKLKQ